MQKLLKITPSRIVGRERAGDRAQCVVRQAQLLGQQVQRAQARRLSCRQGQVLARAGQGLHMARPGDEDPSGMASPASYLSRRWRRASSPARNSS